MDNGGAGVGCQEPDNLKEGAVMCQARNKRRWAKTAGLYFLEGLLMIVVIAFLASMLVPTTTSFGGDDGNQVAAKAQIKNFITATIAYELEYERFPSALEALLRSANPKGITFIDADAIPKDPWGNDYVYTCTGGRFEIISYGADGKQGGSGEYDVDISSEQVRREQRNEMERKAPARDCAAGG